ncbi:MAG: di-trans,poly-cis-decaprenylcistransferase [Paludibacterium sp.]|uniref:polyprenyl diphosphate synthase n=1 Tax=Paludibacterium sp. TaxID=1917523 RepID=UPI0025F4F397|nr:polyprenyl diphosphate synthase [Paludibacterium sp.]MBV8047868.1 di-trans,poly-cis-decaprenylcistransferase [Paludibacterium sp.]MBV8646749.1 di-trans,poly-cis-decaprenylcistransferase [Paludibacterium sp.]
MALFGSSTQAVPEIAAVPRHIAIIMDGNGRWAKKRLLPRVAGHKRGLDAARNIVTACRQMGVEYLTLFAFSTENWRRPQDEVSFLMELFLRALESEVERLLENNIRLHVVGNRARFAPQLNERIAVAEAKTAANDGLVLTIAADYGGRWDVLQAANALLAEGATRIEEADLATRLSMAYAPEPDLFIRTGGEQRISNFLIWQLAYSELYFTDALWPDFDAKALDEAIASYRDRERRFGRTSEQLPEAQRRG